MNSAAHLTSQLSQLSVNGGPTSASQRLRNKRSQRFTVPVQAPNPGASPPFSNSDESATGTTISTAPTSADNSIGFPSSLANGHDQGALFPPSNFAQTGASAPPSFLQQDPFAFAGALGSGNYRTRTISTASNQSLGPWQDQHQQHTGGFAGQGGYHGQSYGAFPNSNNHAGHQNVYQTNHRSLNHMPSQGNFAAAQQQRTADDDVIPTAIVIKNIPFAFPSTSLLQIIEELHLVPPYAFNYHYDQGVFRGLAFANFNTPQDTDACVAAMNGFEIQGRKLRVEYKKVLQAGEKERIERDKAIKRMRSMQLEKDRLLSQQSQLQQQFLNNQFMQLQQTHVPLHQQDDHEDYGRVIHPSNSIFGQANALNDPHALNNVNIAQFTTGTALSSDVPSSSGASTSSRGASSAYELDMNDPQTLEIYSRVLLFRDDGMRDELAFSKTLSATQRRIVHLVAQKLELQHRSVGVGEERHAVVFKRSPSSAADLQQEQQRLRSRASALHLNPEAFSQHRNGLRKKSMPDLRQQQQGYQAQSPAPPVPSLPLTTQSLMTARQSNGDLKTASRRAFAGQGESIPPVPSLPESNSAGSSLISPSTPSSQRHSAFFSPGSHLDRAVGSPIGAGTGSPSHVNGLPALLRQPKGPDTGSSWARIAGSPSRGNTNGTSA